MAAQGTQLTRYRIADGLPIETRLPVTFNDDAVFPYPTASIDPETANNLNRLEVGYTDSVGRQLTLEGKSNAPRRCHTVLSDGQLFIPASNENGTVVTHEMFDRMLILDRELPFRCFNTNGCCQAFCPVILEYNLLKDGVDPKPPRYHVLAHFRCQNSPDGPAVTLNENAWVVHQLQCQKALTSSQREASLGTSFGASDDNVESGNPVRPDPKRHVSVRLCPYHRKLLGQRGSMLFWGVSSICKGIVSAISQANLKLIGAISAAAMGGALSLGRFLNKTVLYETVMNGAMTVSRPLWGDLPYAASLGAFAAVLLYFFGTMSLNAVASEWSIERRLPTQLRQTFPKSAHIRLSDVQCSNDAIPRSFALNPDGATNMFDKYLEFLDKCTTANAEKEGKNAKNYAMLLKRLTIQLRHQGATSTSTLNDLSSSTRKRSANAGRNNNPRPTKKPTPIVPFESAKPQVAVSEGLDPFRSELAKLPNYSDECKKWWIEFAEAWYDRLRRMLVELQEIKSVGTYSHSEADELSRKKLNSIEVESRLNAGNFKKLSKQVIRDYFILPWALRALNPQNPPSWAMSAFAIALWFNSSFRKLVNFDGPIDYEYFGLTPPPAPAPIVERPKTPLELLDEKISNQEKKLNENRQKDVKQLSLMQLLGHEKTVKNLEIELEKLKTESQKLTLASKIFVTAPEPEIIRVPRLPDPDQKDMTGWSIDDQLAQSWLNFIISKLKDDRFFERYLPKKCTKLKWEPIFLVPINTLRT